MALMTPEGRNIIDSLCFVAQIPGDFPGGFFYLVSQCVDIFRHDMQGGAHDGNRCRDAMCCIEHRRADTADIRHIFFIIESPSALMDLL